MGPTDEVEVVSVEELAHHVCAEGEAHPAIVLAPALHVLVGVRPQQVTQQACNNNNSQTCNNSRTCTSL